MLYRDYIYNSDTKPRGYINFFMLNSAEDEIFSAYKYENANISWHFHILKPSKLQIQSTLVISNSKRLSEILRDIRTSTYQICRIEEKIIRTTTFYKWLCNLTLEFRDILIILSSSFPQYFFTCC